MRQFHAGREFLFLTAGGACFGGAVGFFFFLHLGIPGQPYLTGFVSGLFVMAGVKVGFVVWLVRGGMELFQRLRTNRKTRSARED
jgi:hypothetical protein